MYFWARYQLCSNCWPTTEQSLNLANNYMDTPIQLCQGKTEFILLIFSYLRTPPLGHPVECIFLFSHESFKWGLSWWHNIFLLVFLSAQIRLLCWNLFRSFSTGFSSAQLRPFHRNLFSRMSESKRIPHKLEQHEWLHLLNRAQYQSIFLLRIFKLWDFYRESTPWTATKTAGTWNFSKNISSIFFLCLVGFMLASVSKTGH